MTGPQTIPGSETVSQGGPEPILKQEAPPPRDTTLNIHQRLLGVMEAVSYVLKEGTAPREIGGFPYVRHDDVVAAIRPHLIQHGVLLLPSVVEHQMEMLEGKKDSQTGEAKKFFFTTIHMQMNLVNVDNPEDKVIVHSYGYGMDRQDKGIGKAITTATKSAILKAFCLETGEDVERQNADFLGSQTVQTVRPTPKPPSKIDPATKKAKEKLLNATILWAGLAPGEGPDFCRKVIARFMEKGQEDDQDAFEQALGAAIQFVTKCQQDGVKARDVFPSEDVPEIQAKKDSEKPSEGVADGKQEDMF